MNADKRRIVAAVKRQREAEGAARFEATAAQLRSSEREKAVLRRQLGEALLFNDDLKAAVSKLPEIALAKRGPVGKVDVTLGVLVGDWHIGERINKDEMGGFNAYDLSIATKRIEILIERILRWLALIRLGYNVKECWVVILGDMVQGELHEEYMMTNEFPVPMQAVKAGHLLAKLLTELCREFERVTVDCIGADNHGRLSRKIQFKEAARNSHNYTVYEVCRAILVNQKRLAMNYHLPLKAQVNIAGRSALIEHGHTTKGWMGIPWFGIERGESREAKKRMRYGKPYTDHFIGHWHAPADLPGGLMINGALCGATEFDSGASRFATASQTSFLIHEKHGVFSRIVWELQEGER